MVRCHQAHDAVEVCPRRHRSGRAPATRGSHSTRWRAVPDDDADDDDANDEGPTEESKILKLFEAPAFTSRALSEFLRKMFGGSRSFGDDSAGAELPIGAVRRARQVGANARPLPIRIEFADKGRPDVAVSAGGALYSGMGYPQRPLPAAVVPGHRFSADLRGGGDTPPRAAPDHDAATAVYRESAWVRRFCVAAPMVTNWIPRHSSTCS